jgi:flagellar biosynthetic protein FliR
MFEIWFSDLHHFFFVFARVFGLVLGMPFLNQIEVSGRFRAVACIALTLGFNPLVADDYFPAYANFLESFWRFAAEFFIGFFVGMIARFALAALELSGHFISLASGLSSASSFTTLSGHSLAITAFLINAGITSFLLLDGHHYLFKNLLSTYTRFGPDWFSCNSPLINDTFKGFAELTGVFFKAGFQLSIPFFIVNTVLQIALGILGKLVPQIQVFFLGLSVQIILIWFVLIVCFGAMLSFYERLNLSIYSLMGFTNG